MIPEPLADDAKIDLDAEYQLADRDSMRRAIIRRCQAAESHSGDLGRRQITLLVDMRFTDSAHYFGNEWMIPAGTQVPVSNDGIMAIRSPS